MSAERRPWITRTEFVVASLMLLMLAALAVSMLSNGYASPRKEFCANNFRQLALAHQQLATRKPAAFVGYLAPQRISDGASIPDEDLTTSTREVMVAWPTKLLPSLDMMMIHEVILTGDNRFDLNAPPPIDMFSCPADPQYTPLAAGLSYVVNTGMPDFTAASATQPSDLGANGVCHDQRPGRFGPTVRLGSNDFRDGADHTILLSENIHRDPAGSAQQPGNTWLRPATGAANPEQWYGMVWLVDPQNPRSPRAELVERFNRDTRAGDEREQPYAASGARFARPSSNHGNTFNVAFCGGNVKEIDENIDYVVYQQLMTPNGAKAAPADAPDRPFEKTLPDDQRFMNPPVTDADF